MGKNILYNGDCLIESDKIESSSVDLILTDLPYGTVKGAQLDGWNGTKTDWDEVIDTKEIYKVANRILRKNGKMVLFCQEPFTTELINKAIPNIPFSYRMIWEKDHFANSLIAKKAPVNYFEDVCVFTNKDSGGLMNKCVEKISDVVFSVGFHKFAEIMFGEGRYKNIESARKNLYKKVYIEGCNEYDKNFFDEHMYRYLETQIEMPYTFDEYFSIVADYKERTKSVFNLWEGKKYKSNILKYKKDYNGYHPTQKPVLLLEDLIKTFSNENDLVVDLTAGSFSTAIACINTKRKFIGIEKDENYFNIGKERIKKYLDSNR